MSKTLRSNDKRDTIGDGSKNVLENNVNIARIYVAHELLCTLQCLVLILE